MKFCFKKKLFFFQSFSAKENPKAATTSTKISAPKPQQLGGGPGSTIQVPFSKEKMLWSAAMTDKGDGKKK